MCTVHRNVYVLCICTVGSLFLDILFLYMYRSYPNKNRVRRITIQVTKHVSNRMLIFTARKRVLCICPSQSYPSWEVRVNVLINLNTNIFTASVQCYVQFACAIQYCHSPWVFRNQLNKLPILRHAHIWHVCLVNTLKGFRWEVCLEKNVPAALPKPKHLWPWKTGYLT